MTSKTARTLLLVVLTAAVIGPANANSKEITLNCKLTMDSDPQVKASNRTYIFDEETPKVWTIVDGARLPLCEDADCQFSLSKTDFSTKIVFNGPNPMIREAHLDRSSGEFREVITLPNSSMGPATW